MKALTVKQLISILNKMVSCGEIEPDAEIVISHDAKDHNLVNVDWIWSNIVDEGDTEKILVLEG